MFGLHSTGDGCLTFLNKHACTSLIPRALLREAGERYVVVKVILNDRQRKRDGFEKIVQLYNFMEFHAAACNSWLDRWRVGIKRRKELE